MYNPEWAFTRVAADVEGVSAAAVVDRIGVEMRRRTREVATARNQELILAVFTAFLSAPTRPLGPRPLIGSVRAPAPSSFRLGGTLHPIPARSTPNRSLPWSGALRAYRAPEEDQNSLVELAERPRIPLEEGRKPNRAATSKPHAPGA